MGQSQARLPLPAHLPASPWLRPAADPRFPFQDLPRPEALPAAAATRWCAAAGRASLPRPSCFVACR